MPGGGPDGGEPDPAVDVEPGEGVEDDAGAGVPVEGDAGRADRRDDLVHGPVPPRGVAEGAGRAVAALGAAPAQPASGRVLVVTGGEVGQQRERMSRPARAQVDLQPEDLP